MDLAAQIREMVEAGIDLTDLGEQTVYQDAHGMHHYSDRCDQYCKGMFGGVFHKSKRTSVTLTTAAVEKTLCACCTSYNLGWSARETHQAAETILKLLKATSELAATASNEERNPVTLHWRSTKVSHLLQETTTSPPKVERLETKLAFTLQGAEAELHRAEALMRTAAHQEALLALCAQGVSDEANEAASSAGLVGTGHALVHLSSYTRQNRANLLDAVVHAWRIDPEGESSAERNGEILSCPLTVANWVRYATLGRQARAKVAPLQAGDDEKVVETALGLYEPGGDAEMGDLKEALQAARRV